MGQKNDRDKDNENNNDEDANVLNTPVYEGWPKVEVQQSEIHKTTNQLEGDFTYQPPIDGYNFESNVANTLEPVIEQEHEPKIEEFDRRVNGTEHAVHDKFEFPIITPIVIPSAPILSNTPAPYQYIEAEFPSELKKAIPEQLVQLCRDYRLSWVSRTKWELIGRLLIHFPKDVLIEEDLDKFSLDQLRQMCTGAWISNRGEKSALIERLIKYGTRNLLQPATPSKPRLEEKRTKKYRSRKPTDRAHIKHIDTPGKISKKRKLRSDLDGTSDVEVPPLKKRKLPEPENFIEIAPTLPVTIENQYYDIPPEKFSDEHFGWKKSGRQKVKVSGQEVLVKWEVKMEVVDSEEEELTE